MSHVAIILAAGKGTRMKSSLPKVLHPVAGRSMLDWVLDAVSATDPERIMVVVGHGAEHVVAGLPEGVETVVQPEQNGTGHAAEVGLSALGTVASEAGVLVVPGDTPMIDADTLARLVRRHTDSGASVTMLTTEVSDPTGYGRVIRRPDGTVSEIVEEKDAGVEVRAIREINAGMYVFRAGELMSDLAAVTAANAQGERYLTDVIGLTVARGSTVQAEQADPVMVAGVNDHAQLAAAAALHRRRIAARWMSEGVRMIDPDRVYIDHGVGLAPGVTLYPDVILEGSTRVGEGTTLGPGVFVSDSTIAGGCHIWYSVVRGASVAPECTVGPYASLRPGTVLERGAHLGTFVETKKTVVGEGAKVPHLSYIGDATIGARSNIGAGSITCNYDGFEKHQTTIGDDVFIGSDTMLIAPVTIGDGAMTAAGSAITLDVEPGAMGVARGRQRNIPGFVERLTARYRARRSEQVPD